MGVDGTGQAVDDPDVEEAPLVEPDEPVEDDPLVELELKSSPSRFAGALSLTTMLRLKTCVMPSVSS